MRFFSPQLSVVPVFATLCCISINLANADAQPTNQTNNNQECSSINKSPPPYKQLPHGQTTYDLDDGGCYFCAKFPGSTFALSDYNELSNHCEQMCGTDPECTAFTIARPAALHAHEYWWGKAANCCLERETYPPETFIHPPKFELGGIDNDEEEEEEPTICQLDTLCWTRFENKCKPYDAAAALFKAEPRRTPPPKSDLCKRVWKARKYTNSTIQKQINIIKEGCQYDDTKYISMLKEAYNECKSEILNPESTLNQRYSHRQAWVAHGLIGSLCFGLLVPLSVFSSYFRDWLIPQHWMMNQIYLNILTFITVVVAFVTMNGMMGNSGEGHMKEIHHIVGLLLLLLVSLQTAVSGFLQSSHRRVMNHDDDNDNDEGEEDVYQKDTATTGTAYWHQHINIVFGFIIFGIGAYQIHSGLGLYTKRYDTSNWWVYIYIVWLLVVTFIWWMKMRARVVKFATSKATTEVQLPPYDPII